MGLFLFLRLALMFLAFSGISAHDIARWLHSDRDCVTCRIIEVDTVMYEESHEPRNVQTHCVVVEDGYETDLDFPIELPNDIEEANRSGIGSGKLMLSVCDNRSEGNSQSMLASDLTFRVLDSEVGFRILKQRHLKADGKLTVALIGVSTIDSKPTHSAKSMSAQLFGPGLVNMRSQYDACSFGKLQWDVQESGILDVVLPTTISSFESASAVVLAAQEQIKKRLFLRSVADLADKVLICIPPGTGDWAASAGVNHWRVQLNNEWCVSLSGTMHELAHTIGLLHANANGKKYADRSGVMGSGRKDSSRPQKCFNGYHSHQLGWYTDRTLTLTEEPDALVELASFVDYKKTTSQQSVIVNIADQYFLIYNVAKEFNKGTENERNKVTITVPTSNGTDRLAGLRVGDSYQVANFQNSGNVLIIEACWRHWSNGLAGVDTMVMSIALSKTLCSKSPSLDDHTQQKTVTDRSLAQRFLRFLLAKPAKS